MLRLEDIFVVFYRGTPLERIALRGINLAVQDGEVISILGNNGSGRSTLLKLLAGHINSSFGRISLNKEVITYQSLSKRSMIFSSVFYDQSISTASNLTVLENLVLASMHHQPKSFICSAIDDETRETFFAQLKELDFLNIENLLDEKVSNISKAYRQVLAILIAVIKESKILLIDEHSTGLDGDMYTALLAATKKIISEKKITTIIAVTDVKFAIDISDKIFVLKRGQIVSEFARKSQENIQMEKVLATIHQ
jgi:putative ABC transport system ATP-binding protein